MTDTKRLYTFREACAAIAADEKTVRKYIRHLGIVPQLSADRRLRLYSRADLDRISREIRRTISGQLDDTAADAARISFSQRELAARVTDLERRVAALELPRFIARAPVPTLPLANPLFDVLPGGLVGAIAFAHRHGIHENTVRKAIHTRRLPTIEGRWKHGRATIDYALDADGRSAFYRLWHLNPHFRSCPDCPHDQ